MKIEAMPKRDMGRYGFATGVVATAMSEAVTIPVVDGRPAHQAVIAVIAGLAYASGYFARKEMIIDRGAEVLDRAWKKFAHLFEKKVKLEYAVGRLPQLAAANFAIRELPEIAKNFGEEIEGGWEFRQAVDLEDGKNAEIEVACFEDNTIMVGRIVRDGEDSEPRYDYYLRYVPRSTWINHETDKKSVEYRAEAWDMRPQKGAKSGKPKRYDMFSGVKASKRDAKGLHRVAYDGLTDSVLAVKTATNEYETELDKRLRENGWGTPTEPIEMTIPLRLYVSAPTKKG